MESSHKAHIIYISHGGGPLPLMNDPGHLEMVKNLQHIAEVLPKPDAIVIFSAHWESAIVEITSAAQPNLFYDYYGFPPETYKIQYPAQGHPALASEIAQCFSDHKIEHQLNDERGFDHGMFIPLTIMYPEADIPCIQVSLNRNLKPEDHINMGKALATLKQQNILFIGSGLSFHNMQAFMTPSTSETRQMNLEFEQWLNQTISDTNITESEREAKLNNWANAPSARYCHPREEHLLPLHICYGIAQQPCSEAFHFQVLAQQASAFIWSPE